MAKRIPKENRKPFEILLTLETTHGKMKSQRTTSIFHRGEAVEKVSKRSEIVLTAKKQTGKMKSRLRFQTAHKRKTLWRKAKGE